MNESSIVLMSRGRLGQQLAKNIARPTIQTRVLAPCLPPRSHKLKYCLLQLNLKNLDQKTFKQQAARYAQRH